jgi:hypothetical protein
MHHSETQDHDNGGRLKLANGFHGFPQLLSISAQFNLSELTALFDSLPFNNWTNTTMTKRQCPSVY